MRRTTSHGNPKQIKRHSDRCKEVKNLRNLFNLEVAKEEKANRTSFLFPPDPPTRKRGAPERKSNKAVNKPKEATDKLPASKGRENKKKGALKTIRFVDNLLSHTKNY